MACVTYKWRQERVDALLSALKSSRTLDEAAATIGETGASVRGVCREKRIDYRSLLLAAPASAGVSVSAPDEPEPPPLIDWTGARPVSSGTGIERRLILGDLHIPFHSVSACSVVLAVARSIQPHVIIALGDVFNMGAVSHHPRPFGGRENHRGSQVQGLSFFDALHRAAPGARKRVLLGNHDDWATEYEDEHPEHAGLFAAQQLGLHRYGVELVPREHQPLVLGPVAYRHGYGGGEHFAKRYALDDGPQAGVSCIVVGHHHTIQRFHAKNGVECWGAGWLGESRHSAFHYAKNPRNWEVGFLVQDIIGEHVTTTPVRIRNGAALFGGRLIGRAA